MQKIAPHEGRLDAVRTANIVSRRGLSSKEAQVQRTGIPLSRRGFLAAAPCAAAGLLFTGLAASAVTGQAQASKTAVPTRRMGRTNLDISVIAGNETLAEPALAEAAMAAGVNYWHKGGPGLMPAIRKFGREKQYVELCIDATGSAEKDAERFKSCLTNGLEYADFYKMHGGYNDKSFEAFGKLKEKGLVRFVSASFHDHDEALKAVRAGNLDQIHIGASPVMDEKTRGVIAAAAKADVGVVLMKTMMGGKDGWKGEAFTKAVAPYVEKGLSTPQAIVAACLAVEGVTSLVVITGSLQRFQALAEAATFAADSKAADTPCVAPALAFCAVCGACKGVCPRGTAIADVMRAEMYLRGYGDAGKARRTYAAIGPGRRGASCSDCGACRRACSRGVASPERIAAARVLLT